MHKFAIVPPVDREDDSDAELRDENTSVVLIDTSLGKPLDRLLTMLGNPWLKEVRALVAITETVVDGRYYKSGLYLRIVARSNEARDAYLTALDGFLENPATLLDVEVIAEEIAEMFRRALQHR